VGIYLRSMVGGHVHAHGEPLWSRALSSFDRIWNETRQFSFLLPSTLLFVALIFVFAPSETDSPGALLRRLRAVFVGSLLSGLAVGMGGHFYGHQFVFATPFHLSLVFALMARVPTAPEPRRAVGPALAVLSLLCVVVPRWVPPSEFDSRLQAIQKHDREAREAARVMDRILDDVGVERYLWLGHPGWAPLPFTEHTPQGPLFFQQVMFFEGRFTWLANRFREGLQGAQVVFFAQHMTGPLDDHVKKVLARDFVRLPEALVPKNDYFPYKVFVRRGLRLPAPAASTPG
jgi:hypothetical protein